MILVGQTGAGKGRLGNWLYSFGVTSKPEGLPFQYASLAMDNISDPCTKEPELFVFEDFEFNILDTPGM